jgi:predicted NBD/HSP70 family sugar kinase
MEPDPISRSLPLADAIRALLSALHAGPKSVPVLAEVTKLGPDDVTRLLERLTATGHVARTGSKETSESFGLHDAGGVVIGVDLGGTKVHVALADLSGTLLAEALEATDARGGRHVVRQIRTLVNRLQRKTGRPIDVIHAAAMGSPGVMDSQTGAIAMSPNIPGLDTFDVVEALQQELGCTLILENDVNLAALGERCHADSETNQNFAFIALGTGIGLGLITNGRLVRGAHGAAGEIAFLPLGQDPFEPANYKLGPLETAVGSAGILNAYRGFGGTAADSVREIFDQVAAGEPKAIATLDYTARLVLKAILAIRAIIDPGAIILGGSIGARPELLERLQALSAPLPIELTIRPSVLGSRAALIGATSLAISHACERLFGDPIADPEAGGRGIAR